MTPRYPEELRAAVLRGGTAWSRTSALRHAAGVAVALCAAVTAGALVGHRIVSLLLTSWAIGCRSTSDVSAESS